MTESLAGQKATGRVAKAAPCLKVDIPPEQKVRLDRLLPKGVRKLVINALLDDLLTLLESSEGEVSLVLGLILTKQLRLTDGYKGNESPKTEG